MATEVASTREQILAAAAEIIHREGFGAATTRAIAERAGCAEGSIYRHFPDKHGLIIEIVHTRFPDFLELVSGLPDRAGRGSVRGNLEHLAAASLRFYRGVLPLVAGALADHELLLQQRRSFAETGGGPMMLFRATAAYLRREQELGRVAPRASADHVARLLLGGCFFQAYLEAVLGEAAAGGPDRQFVRRTVRVLLDGLEPERPPPG